ncbi:fibroblast growth factor receptor-like 1 [Amphibalanus amphitrite]|uniref:fibroblast growth factor receptor-like 1 n=1 Tax=Amphibalanus amphitrite TaxID=1232801 RepID=UPI001C91361E|nr:fibroblast growth factor receptor-like 1 [Amphibalanus amphitrite]XP_043223788.1 fibroblast growth factor receptor-like 1 [Amphibalanus amphitrite]
MGGRRVTRVTCPTCSAVCLLLLVLLVAPAVAVKGPPVLKQKVSPHLVVRLGDDVRLSCPVAATPPPMLEWKKDGTQILDAWDRFTLSENMLRVSRVTEDDAGVYVCIAVNGFGTMRVATELFVIDPKSSTQYNGRGAGGGERVMADNLVTSLGRPPVILLQRPSGAVVRGPVGSRHRLTCTTSGYPEPQVKWYKSGHAVLKSVRVQIHGPTLVFTQLVPSDDGVYICVASNVFGSANHSFTLQTTEPLSPDPVFLAAPANTTVHEGEMAVLQCRIQSISKAHIKWVRKLGPSATDGFNQTVMIGDGRYAVLSGGAHTVQDGDRYLTKLTLPAVRPSHEGVYVCMAANENGFSGREAFLHVAPAPADSMQALLIALPVVALVGFLLGAVCCLQRRRKALPPPSDAKQKHYASSLPPGGARQHYVTQRYDKDGERSVRTVLMPPTPLPVTDDGSLSSRSTNAPPPPPAPYDYRHFRHLDVV